MHAGKLVFSQVMDYLPMFEFRRCARRYGGNRRVRSFTCLDQFLCMAFAQLTYRESLRDIETCLRAMQAKLYHAGFRGRVSRSTLADANETRNWKIYEDFAQVLIAMARELYINDDFGLALNHTAYAFDSTTIDLCLSLFPWAKFRQHKGAVKLHTLIDLRGSIPCFIRISPGKLHDVNALDDLPLEAGAFYIMDRGYIDFKRLHYFNEAKAFYITRAKRNLDYTRRISQVVDKGTGLRSDQMITLNGPKSSKDYPELLRRVSYYDDEQQRRFIYLTNNFTLAALTIAQLYKARWRVELFFKWIKQNLRIKAFYGTSDNAVRTQVWIAVSVYVLVAVIKKRLDVNRSLSEILQILSITLFEKMPISQAISLPVDQDEELSVRKQLLLFDF